MSRNKFDEIDQYRELIDEKGRGYDDAGIEFNTCSELICECHVVSFDEMVTFVTEMKCVNLTQISFELGVGTGCRSCLRNCSAWLKRLENVL